MGRLLFLALVVVGIVWLLKRAIAGPGEPEEARGAAPAAGELVRCAHCGVNLPQSEAYVAPGAGGRQYCSEEHWRAGPRDG